MMVSGISKGRGTVSSVTLKGSSRGVGLKRFGLTGCCRSCKQYPGALLSVGITKPRLCDQEPFMGPGAGSCCKKKAERVKGSAEGALAGEKMTSFWALGS